MLDFTPILPTNADICTIQNKYSIPDTLYVTKYGDTSFQLKATHIRYVYPSAQTFYKIGLNKFYYHSNYDDHQKGFIREKMFLNTDSIFYYNEHTNQTFSCYKTIYSFYGHRIH